MKDRANLHLHSTCSDGMLLPTDLVERCAEHDLGVIALTDHDTDEGVVEAQAAGERLGVDVLSGIEISATMPHREVHILGYGFASGHPRILEYRQRLRDERADRATKMVLKLQEMGLQIEEQDVAEQAGDGMTGRPHIARAMVANGIVEDEVDAFSLYLKDGGPAFVPKRALNAGEAIALIHDTGGVAVMAHPGQWTSDDDIRMLVRAGLDGLEVVHPSHPPYLSEYWMAIALRFGLIRTGGSDYHGSRPEDAALDDFTIPMAWVDILRDRIAEHSIDHS